MPAERSDLTGAATRQAMRVEEIVRQLMGWLRCEVVAGILEYYVTNAMTPRLLAAKTAESLAHQCLMTA